MPFLPPNQQRQSTEGTLVKKNYQQYPKSGPDQFQNSINSFLVHYLPIPKISIYVYHDNKQTEKQTDIKTT